MIRWLASVSPVAVLLAGAIPAGTVGWFAHGVKFEMLDRPAITREATAVADAACAQRVSTAARVAEAAERQRQKDVGLDALRMYRDALTATQAQAAARAQILEQEIADYEAQLALEGRSCQLTDADIDWLHQRRASGSD